MIRYHGTPITPEAAAIEILLGRHGMVSFAYPEQIAVVAEKCQSFVLDNGAFSAWTKGKELDIPGYVEFVHRWRRHPGFDWCLIPDVIDGSEAENCHMIETWISDVDPRIRFSVPVWHLHESIEWLQELAERFPRIAFGSSGEYATIATDDWYDRMDEAFIAISDEQGGFYVPRVKSHGLRMMDNTLVSDYPFASVDSCNVAINIGIDQKWKTHPFKRGLSKSARGTCIALACEHHPVADLFEPKQRRGRGQKSLTLLG